MMIPYAKAQAVVSGCALVIGAVIVTGTTLTVCGDDPHTAGALMLGHLIQLAGTAAFISMRLAALAKHHE